MPLSLPPPRWPRRCRHLHPGRCLGRRRWGGGFHHYWGPGIGVGIGLGVLGAAAAASSYGSCYREVVRDDYGNYLYSRRICD